LPGNGEVLIVNPDSGTSYVLIRDAQGSTIGLVNTSNALQTQFTYQPFDAPTTSGTAGNSRSCSVAGSTIPPACIAVTARP